MYFPIGPRASAASSAPPGCWWVGLSRGGGGAGESQEQWGEQRRGRSGRREPGDGAGAGKARLGRGFGGLWARSGERCCSIYRGRRAAEVRERESERWEDWGFSFGRAGEAAAWGFGLGGFPEDGATWHREGSVVHMA